MMKQQGAGFWRAIAAAGLLLLAAGCGHRRPTEIVVITPTGGMEYWEDFVHAVRARAAAADIHAEVAAPQSVTDYTEQAQMVDRAIARHVQGIIVAPSHQLVLASVLEKARRAGIPVVVVGTPIALQQSEFTAFIGWDEAAAGRQAARRLVALLHGHGEVGMVGVSPTVEGSSRVEKAFADEIARAPRVKLVSVKYGLSDWARGRQAVLDMVAEHPQIQGIFTTDEFATHAAALAFHSGTRRRPLLVGITDEKNELDRLRDGGIDAVVLSNPFELGARSMQALSVALAGKDASGYSAQLPVTVIDRQSEAADATVRALYGKN